MMPPMIRGICLEDILQGYVLSVSSRRSGHEKYSLDATRGLIIAAVDTSNQVPYLSFESSQNIVLVADPLPMKSCAFISATR